MYWWVLDTPFPVFPICWAVSAFEGLYVCFPYTQNPKNQSEQRKGETDRLREDLKAQKLGFVYKLYLFIWEFTKCLSSGNIVHKLICFCLFAHLSVCVSDSLSLCTLHHFPHVVKLFFQQRAARFRGMKLGNQLWKEEKQRQLCTY